MGSFLERLRALAPGLPWDELPEGAGARLDRFELACPLYARLLERHPDRVAWLEAPPDPDGTLRFPALLDEWNRFHGGPRPHDRLVPDYPGRLRGFRRKMSLRIAYRDVADRATGAEVVEELTRLAHFHLREAWFIADALWTRRLGEPWDEARGRRARFCVLGLGKLGGGELNFSSDVDLIYLHDGAGRTIRAGRPTSTTNGEFFHRVGETITQLLNERDGDGFLFRTDLRLRPGGAMGPLVPSLAALEVYYGGSGQTWERLALIKARPVAGDLDLGAELLESLQSFRYPRHAPPSLLAEVAAMKQRTESEVVGAGALERDVKSGFGGIREIEFLTQVLQLLHAGRFPFLQTHSTIDALTQLARYGLLAPGDAVFLQEAYWLLRRIEHRLQMREEARVHELPADPEARAALARSLGHETPADFDVRLADVRARVREHYAALFRDAAPEAARAADAWWGFFAREQSPEPVRRRLEAWFGGDPEAVVWLRALVREAETRPLHRDQVARFADLAPALDRLAPRLGRPVETLRRLCRFGDGYASRAQFLSACVANPDFFSTLTLLLDRSTFLAELLRRRPEIFEEILRPEILRRRKDAALWTRELGAHPDEPAAALHDWLWLYHRAETVRIAACEVLGVLDETEAARDLTALAEALLLDLVRRTPGAEGLLIVALGTFGGRELGHGSDLDLLFVAPEAACGGLEAVAHRLLRRFAATDGRDAILEIDPRLRPHGEAGPLVAGFDTLRHYHATSAQTWERQTLTRARVVSGPPESVAEWSAFLDRWVYAPGLSDAQAAGIGRMLERLHRSRPGFKTAPGGRLWIEFAAQALLLRHGAALPSLRTGDTAEAWRRLGEAGVVSPAVAARLRENLRTLQRIEWALRRDSHRDGSSLPEEPESAAVLARWLGTDSHAHLLEDQRRRMQETRTILSGVLSGRADRPDLERPG